jgi:hypothetical protein
VRICLGRDIAAIPLYTTRRAKRRRGGEDRANPRTDLKVSHYKSEERLRPPNRVGRFRVLRG